MEVKTPNARALAEALFDSWEALSLSRLGATPGMKKNWERIKSLLRMEITNQVIISQGASWKGEEFSEWLKRIRGTHVLVSSMPEAPLRNLYESLYANEEKEGSAVGLAYRLRSQLGIELAKSESGFIKRYQDIATNTFFRVLGRKPEFSYDRETDEWSGPDAPLIQKAWYSLLDVKIGDFASASSRLAASDSSVVAIFEDFFKVAPGMTPKVKADFEATRSKMAEDAKKDTRTKAIESEAELRRIRLFTVLNGSAPTDDEKLSLRYSGDEMPSPLLFGTRVWKVYQFLETGYTEPFSVLQARLSAVASDSKQPLAIRELALDPDVLKRYGNEQLRLFWAVLESETALEAWIAGPPSAEEPPEVLAMRAPQSLEEWLASDSEVQEELAAMRQTISKEDFAMLPPEVALLARLGLNETTRGLLSKTLGESQADYESRLRKVFERTLRYPVVEGQSNPSIDEAVSMALQGGLFEPTEKELTNTYLPIIKEYLRSLPIAPSEKQSFLAEIEGAAPILAGMYSQLSGFPRFTSFAERGEAVRRLKANLFSWLKQIDISKSAFAGMFPSAITQVGGEVLSKTGAQPKRFVPTFSQMPSPFRSS